MYIRCPNCKHLLELNEDNKIKDSDILYYLYCDGCNNKVTINIYIVYD